ncbi:MAG: hypothetical protein RSA97_01030 [Oscillospiraceae bacterium]
MKPEIVRVMEHYEVYDANGAFLFSADSRQEAAAELALEYAA